MAGVLRPGAPQSIPPGMTLNWIITCAVIVLALGTTVFAGWKSGRPRKDTLRPQWISWPFVTVFAGALLLFAIIHAMNLLGFQTGQNTTGRYGG